MADVLVGGSEAGRVGGGGAAECIDGGGRSVGDLFDFSSSFDATIGDGVDGIVRPSAGVGGDLKAAAQGREAGCDTDAGGGLLLEWVERVVSVGGGAAGGVAVSREAAPARSS